MILDQIVAEKRRVIAVRKPVSLADLHAQVELVPTRDFASSLRRQSEVAVIAEFKRRSPSGGELRHDGNVMEVARDYADHGACALSILTDEKFFAGALSDLATAKSAAALPILRKDFLLDERDLYESKLAGADAVLLIVRILSPPQLKHLVDAAKALRLDALVETHDEREIDVALEAGAAIIGVNHRNLDTLEIDLSRSVGVKARVGDRIVVAESGIRTPADVARMRAHGVDAILVGESLLRARSPGLALQELMA